MPRDNSHNAIQATPYFDALSVFRRSVGPPDRGKCAGLNRHQNSGSFALPSYDPSADRLLAQPTRDISICSMLLLSRLCLA